MKGSHYVLRCSRCGRTVESPTPSYVAGRCHQPPGFMRRTVNFAVASAQHVGAGLPQADEATVRARLSLCQSNACGFYAARSDADGVCTHSLCGCLITAAASVVSKLRWAEQACPVGLW